MLPCVAALLWFWPFVFNFFIEKKLVNTETEEQEVNMTWLRATHSLIFPLAPEQQSKRANLGASLQLVVGDISAMAVGFTVTSLAGLVKGIFLTPNMWMALGVTSIGLTLFSCTALYVIHAWKTSSSSQANDDIEESYDEATETILLLQNSQCQGHTEHCMRALFAILLLVCLIILLATPLPLLLYVFNTCPPFPSFPHSTISCSSPLIVGSQCQLSCSPLHWSSSSLQSQCTWRGAWSEEDLICRPQAAALVGKGIRDDGDWEAAAEVYPASANNSLLPPLPTDLISGSGGYINGGLLYCGGFEENDPFHVPVVSCFSLASPVQGWEETSSLLQVTNIFSHFFITFYIIRLYLRPLMLS